jgi:GNAT superfamily N-acetyltransferase
MIRELLSNPIKTPSGVIRRARPEEAEMLSALALRAKAHWPYDEALMVVFRTFLRIREHDIVENTALVHDTGDLLDAVGILVERPDGPDIDHLWVDPSVIGTGLGRRMAQVLIDLARQTGASQLTLNSDPNAEGFYRRLGFERIGDHLVPEIPGRILPRMALPLSRVDHP